MLAKRIDVVVPVWGEEFVRLFCEVVLPNLLSSGNLIELGKQSEASLCIYTEAEWIPVMERCPAIEYAKGIVSVLFFEIPELRQDYTKYNKMTVAHNLAIKRAIEKDSGLIFLNADVVSSSGSFRRIIELAGQGVRVIEVIGFRTIKQEMERNLKALFSNQSNEICIDSRDLVELAMKYAHPISLSHFVDNKDSSLGGRLPFNYFWEVSNEGVLARGTHLFPLYVYPQNKEISTVDVTIDWDFVGNACPDPDSRYVVRDSDELFIVEMSDVDYKIDPIRNFGIRCMWEFINNSCNSHHKETFKNVILLHSSPSTDNHFWRSTKMRSWLWFWIVMIGAPIYWMYCKLIKTYVLSRVYKIIQWVREIRFLRISELLLNTYNRIRF
jgi:hypothetical protein